MTRRPPVTRQRTTAEVADLLGVDVRTVRRLIAAGLLGARNIATRPGAVRWRVGEDQLADYLAAVEYTPVARIRRSA